MTQRSDEASNCKFALPVDTNPPKLPRQSGPTSIVPKPPHSSDNQNSVNTYTLLPCQGIQTVTTESPGKDSVAISFECTQADERVIDRSNLQFEEHSICSYNSDSTMDFQGAAVYYKDPINNEPLHNSMKDDNRIILTFSPPDDSKSELIIMPRSKDLNSSPQPELTINPHHFDPL